MAAVIVAGKPDESLLFERVTLPAGDKQFMPAEGRPPLAAGRDCVDQGLGSAGSVAIGYYARRNLDSRRRPKDLPLQPVGRL